MKARDAFKPNFTQLPNIILENLHDISPSETKVILAICRQTYGFHREKTYLSINTLARMTGLSERAVINGIQGLLKREWITRAPKALSFEYAIKVEKIEPDQNPSETPANFAPMQNLPSANFAEQPLQNLQGLDQKPLQNLHPLKESTLKKEERKDGSSEPAQALLPGVDTTKKKKFTPPSILDVRAYMAELRMPDLSERFFDHYTANGWMVGKQKMVDWKAAVRTWKHREAQAQNCQPKLDLRSLRERVDTHPANPNFIRHNPNCSPAQIAEYRSLKEQLSKI
jgi:phage replication O-like protein O